MEESDILFLQAMKAALKNETVSWEKALSPQAWLDLFRLAEMHHVLPMVYEAVYGCPAAQKAEPKLFLPYKQRTLQTVALQAMKTGEFLSLYRVMRDAGVAPLVVKGIICRNLYPNPDARISGDEDLLIPQEQFSKFHEIMLDQGLECADPAMDINYTHGLSRTVTEKDQAHGTSRAVTKKDQAREVSRAAMNIDQAHEVPYCRPGGTLYIEAHKTLFPPDSEAYGDLNVFFKDAEARAIEVTVGRASKAPADGNIEVSADQATEVPAGQAGVPIRTMNYTDHMLYLICHAFKHFLHSGFGIRQVCDIIMMANVHGREIDWLYILRQTKAANAEQFTAAVFRIGEKYLTFDQNLAAWPEEWRSLRVDEKPMLLDLLAGGVYGAADRVRLHSSTVTLNAVAAQKKGKAGAGILKSVFPNARSLSGQYPYLRTKPYLLPAAWVSRLWQYRKELRASGGGAAESMKLGEQRVELLKIYGIIR